MLVVEGVEKVTLWSGKASSAATAMKGSVLESAFERDRAML
jgi:hypothetical protein